MAVTTISYRTLLFPELYPHHRGWASQAITQMNGRQLNGRQLKALSIVHPRGRRMPDFLTPLPSRPTETVEGEIRSLTQASVEDLRTDADIARRAAHHPADAAHISQFVEQVAAMRDHLTDDIWHYWEQVIRPAWREIEAILEGDILFRTQQMGKFGIDYMLANLAADVTFRDELLLITANTEARTTLSGQGLVLCPNPFADYTWFQRVGRYVYYVLSQRGRDLIRLFEQPY